MDNFLAIAIIVVLVILGIVILAFFILLGLIAYELGRAEFSDYEYFTSDTE